MNPFKASQTGPHGDGTPLPNGVKPVSMGGPETGNRAARRRADKAARKRERRKIKQALKWFKDSR